MENELTHPHQIDPPSHLPKKPVFLIVLCIISFAGVAFGTWYFGKAVYPALTLDPEELLRSDSPEARQMIDMPSRQEMTSMLFWNLMCLIVCLVSQFISLIGVLLMWHLKKAGFYIYTISELGSMSLLLFVMVRSMLFYNMSEMGGVAMTFSWIRIVFLIVFDVGFVIMYALNLKHFKSRLTLQKN